MGVPILRQNKTGLTSISYGQCVPFHFLHPYSWKNLTNGKISGDRTDNETGFTVPPEDDDSDEGITIRRTALPRANDGLLSEQ